MTSAPVACPMPFPKPSTTASTARSIELRDVDNAEPGMSPMGIWCNEAQERYVLIVDSDRIEEFRRSVTGTVPVYRSSAR